MASDKNPPLSELLPGLMGVVPPPPATLEELAEGPLVPRLVPRPAPINLPKYTILTGNYQRCYDLAKALAAQSQLVYVTDFREPIFDGVQAMLGIEFGRDMGDPEVLKTVIWTLPVEDYVEELAGLPLPLESICFEKCEELSSTQTYQFVIRDGGQITPFDLRMFPNHVVINADITDMDKLRELFK